MSLQGWGRFPRFKSTIIKYQDKEQLGEILSTPLTIIAYGNGRSYGDSALNDTIIHMKPHDYFIDFDDTSGLLHVQSGVLLADILEYFVPKGWFFKVTPGTKLITIGGAIASDVHGKNHHAAGCFSETIKEFEIMLADGSIVICSKELTPELFKATCGGMGLTGIILNAKIYLKSINSQFIDQTTIKTKNLRETFDAFEQYKKANYSVAWIDCLAKGNDLGRCLLMAGDFRDDGRLDYNHSNKFDIPFNFPSIALNNWSVRAFNWLYYGKVKERITKQKVGIDEFFYPLDTVGHWNRIYGKKGFTQYQCVFPKASSYSGLQEMLKTISDSGKGSFLAVLKLCGETNDNYLSFPLEGYSLALDFKMEAGILELLDKLDNIIAKYNGRIYLAKDARVNKDIFELGYPQIEAFRQYRRTHKMNLKFESLQSKRLKI
ncbi:MAG TPA: FAD-binding oxidoreductase [bacterium]|nr:FAD-binding oxidoreductase [bacterium]